MLIHLFPDGLSSGPKMMHPARMPRIRACLSLLLASLLLAAIVCMPARAKILWSDPASRVIHTTPGGTDILGGGVKRDDKASDVLYFKFHVDPLSDIADEPYYALFQLCETNSYRLGMGNALEAWGYSAAYAAETGPSNRVNADEAFDADEFNLNSSHPEGAGLGKFFPYELPSHDRPRTIVFKVQYIPGGDDLITVWLDPVLSHGATPENQPENLTTKFKANASFNEIRLRHDGTGGLRHDGGNGWIFSDMAIATSFDDFVVVRFWETWWFRGLLAFVLLMAMIASVRFTEKKKYQLQIRRAEQEHALERERARIAQDLHDDLGSSLTRITLLSSLLRAEKDNPEQTEINAQKIAQSADQTVRALEEIVWAVRPGSDTLQSLLDYIAHFSNELFEGNSTRCRLNIPNEIPAQPLPPDVRHNIFLIVKETLTNVLKHADATEVQLQVKLTGSALEITISDNGRGFDVNSAVSHGERNGLENMRRRAGAVGGTLALTSERGSGSRMEFRMHFPG
jgi:signal transduction histidine kinase